MTTDDRIHSYPFAMSADPKEAMTSAELCKNGKCRVRAIFIRGIYKNVKNVTGTYRNWQFKNADH